MKYVRIVLVDGAPIEGTVVDEEDSKMVVETNIGLIDIEVWVED